MKQEAAGSREVLPLVRSLSRRGIPSFTTGSTSKQGNDLRRLDDRGRDVRLR